MKMKSQAKKQRYIDPVVECYKKDVDRTIIRENLKLTVQQRVDRFMEFMRFAEQLRKAGEQARQTGKL
jgi:hypothetical protein